MFFLKLERCRSANILSITKNAEIANLDAKISVGKDENELYEVRLTSILTFSLF